MLTEVVAGVTVWRVVGVGSEGLGESRLNVDQLRADDGGAELRPHVGPLSLSLSLDDLLGLRLRPVTGNRVGCDQHCPLSRSHSNTNYPLTASSSHGLKTGPGPADPALPSLAGTALYHLTLLLTFP